MTGEGRTGQGEDARSAETSTDARRTRLAKMNEEPWGKFLMRTLLQLLLIVVIGALVFWFLGR